MKKVKILLVLLNFLIIFLLALSAGPACTSSEETTETPVVEPHIFSVGEEVLLKWQTWEITKIVQIAEDGKILLDDNQWHSQKEILALVEEYQGFTVGEEVVETYLKDNYDSFEITEVEAISIEGDFLVKDGHWYESKWIKKMTSENGGYKLGDYVAVYEVNSNTTNSQPYHIYKILAITDDGSFYLNNYKWYKAKNFTKMDGDLYPNTGLEEYTFKIGQTVLEKRNSWSSHPISVISQDGKVQLDDKFYDITELQPLVDSLFDYKVGDMALNKGGLSWHLRKILAISGDGYFLMDDEKWDFIDYIIPLLNEYKGFKVGDIVMENVNNSSVGQITAISKDGDIQLDNKKWYLASDIAHVEN